MTRGGLVKAVRRGLVGREAELAIIQRCLDGLSAARSPAGAVFVEIAGEPGIGKSRLLGELALLAAQRGLVVASGRATEFERGVPFGAVVEALDDHLTALDPGDRQRLCGDWSGLLAEVFPALHVWLPGGGAGVMEAERYRLHRAVRALLEALAEPSGLVVLLDDVHWADPASVELLVHLLRHPPRAPVLIGLSYRVNQAPAALGAALADPAHGEMVQRLGLGPLNVQAAAELLGRPIDQCRLLHQRSGGNPFYLQLLAEGYAETLDATGRRGIGDLNAAVPTNLGAALVAELGSLSPTRRLVAQAAAVVGDPLEPHLVAPTAGMQAAETLDALDDLVARDLLRAADDRGRLQFRHPLVRHLTYASAGAGWRASAHARLATLLKQQDAPLVARAHHVARAAQPGDEDAISLLLAAAETTLPSSPATAAEWLSAAAHLLPTGHGAAPRRLELLLGLANALRLSGQLVASRDTFSEALPLIPQESLELRARVITAQAALERLLGRYPQARALLEGELDLLAQVGAAEAADLLFELASSARVHGDYTEAHEWAAQALTSARDHDPLLSAAALSLVARTTASNGDPSHAVALLDEATVLLDSLPDEVLVARVETTVWVGWAELLFDRYGDAMRHFARGLTLARRTRQNHVSTRLLVGQATGYGLTGRLTEATEVAVAAAEAAEMTTSHELLATAMAMRCWFATWAGDIRTARWAGEQAVAAATTIAGAPLVFARTMLAHVHLAEGDGARCVSDVLRAGGGAELPDVYPLTRATCYEILVRAELAHGNRTRALDWACKAETGAAMVGIPGQLGTAQLARAKVLLDDDPQAGAERACAAASVFTRLGDRLRTGRARLLAGQALAGAGVPVDAVRELDGARVLFADVGAPRLHAEAVRGLRRLGRRTPPLRIRSTATPGPHSLTTREEEVAGLVTRGYSNRQIAEELVLSVRTVSTHVSHILAKLGVASRSGVAIALHDTRLTSGPTGRGTPSDGSPSGAAGTLARPR